MTEVRNFQGSKVKILQATISNGQTESDIIDLQGTTIAGLYMPGAFTGTNLTFLASFDGSTFVPVENGNSSNVTVVVSTSIYVPLSPQEFYGIRSLKIVSDQTEGGNRVITIVPYPI